MKTITLDIINRTGLHARPAKVLVGLAKKYKANISIQLGAKKVNAKSMVSLLTLGAVGGSQVTLLADGEDEDAALQEIGAAIASGLGDSPEELITAQAPSAPAAKKEETRPAGVAASPGIAIGPAFQYLAGGAGFVDGAAPVMSLASAMAQARAQLQDLIQSLHLRNMAAEAAIFGAHVEVLDDSELASELNARAAQGEADPSAWNECISARVNMLSGLSDPTLAMRADDVRDVGRRVRSLLFGAASGAALPDHPVILIARELTPSDTASFDAKRILGIALAEGGPTSHVAILARALGIPAIVSAGEHILQLANGTPCILNGSAGAWVANPTPAQLDEAAQAQKRRLEQRQAEQSQSGLAAITTDGRKIDVTANIGSAAEAARAIAAGADGVGLLRTEFLFLERNTQPDEAEQLETYRAIAQTMGARPVIVRTLDIGGDKPLAYIQQKKEDNPFLGERGIRLCLARPELFRQQLRAILKAAPDGNLRIMFPMVSDIGEIFEARAIIEELRRELGAPAVPLGIMIEVPSAALMADKLAPHVDFFSAGTNDLTQYTLAIDRGHPLLADKHDGLHPAVLRLLKLMADAAHKNGKRADVCGELGSDPAAIPILVGLGIDELSVNIAAAPAVKAQIRRLSYEDAKDLAQKALECSTASEVRQLVANQGAMR